MIKDAIRVIEKEGEKYKTILTTDVIKLLKTIDDYHETELKKLRVADVISRQSLIDAISKILVGEQLFVGYCKSAHDFELSQKSEEDLADEIIDALSDGL